MDAYRYQSFLEEYEGLSTAVIDDAPVFRDLDGEPVAPRFIGRKWLLVVDCHS